MLRMEEYSYEQIKQYICSLIATTCNLPKDAIDPSEELLALGINSLLAAQINIQIFKNFSLDLPFEQIANGASIETIAQYFFRKFNSTSEEIFEDNDLCSSNEILNKIALLPSQLYDIKSLAQYRKLFLQKALFKKAQVELPYYRAFSSPSTDKIAYNGRELINFASYNYLGLTGDSRVNQAAMLAINDYGTSAGSSRLVSGEKEIHCKLEEALKDLYQVEDALVFVSGYMTNVSVISHLMDKNDLIIHDSLAHNSIVLGSQFSQAKRMKFEHNNMQALEEILINHRLDYERVLIVVEGLYSMDGDTANLSELVRLKKLYKCLLMVDEAHSIGVLGEKGLGIREHGGVNSRDVDIWMGTLSKSFAGCGGYIAGCAELIFYLKYRAPGMVFSVGMAPPVAAASLKAIELLIAEPWRVKLLQNNSQYFLSLLKERELNTGLAEGYAIIPVILGHSLNTAKLTNKLFENGINVQSITYPGVDESSARIRFFISALHTETQMNFAADKLLEYMI